MIICFYFKKLKMANKEFTVIMYKNFRTPFFNSFRLSEQGNKPKIPPIKLRVNRIESNIGSVYQICSIYFKLIKSILFLVN